MTPPTVEHSPLLSPGSIGVLALGAACVACVFALRRRLLTPDALRARAAAAAAIPASRWVLAGLTGWIAWVLGTMLAMSALPPDPKPAIWMRALASVPGYLVGLIAIGAALWPTRREARAAGFRTSPLDLRDGGIGSVLGLPIIVAIGMIVFVVAELLARATNSPSPNEIAHGTLSEILATRDASGISWWMVPIALQVVVLAPLFEETLYRGCLQSAFVSATGRPWGSILATSALFALIHAAIVPWHAMPTLFAVGVLCGIAFERTGRLGTPVLIHAAFNAVNLGMALATAG
jgi:membrane protease YdiL (CAAX protease family)